MVYGIQMNQIQPKEFQQFAQMGQEMKPVPSSDFLRHLVVWGL